MSVNTVLELIKGADIKSAYERSKVLFSRSGREAEALLILKELQAYSHRVEKSASSIDYQAVYLVTNECFATLSRGFKTVDEVKLSTYLYYILNVLFKSDLTHCERLIAYFFSLKRAKSISSWKPNVTSTFSHIIIASVKSLEKDYNHDRFTHWFSFASKIYQLDAMQPISRLISGFNSCLFKITEKDSLGLVFAQLSDWLKLSSDVNSFADKDVSMFLAFVQNSFVQVFMLKGGLSQLRLLRSSFDHFKNKSGKRRVDLELFSSLLGYMCATDSSTAEIFLQKIYNFLSQPAEITSETVNRIVKILSKFGSQFPRHKEVDMSELRMLLKTVMKLYGLCLKKKSTDSISTSDLAYLLLYGLNVFLAKDRIAADVIEIHGLLKVIFETACTLKVNPRISVEILLNSMGKTLIVYKNCQLDSQMNVMSILTLKVLHKLESDWLKESVHLKWWAERLPGFIATSSAKSKDIENALVALVGFGGVHKDFTHEVFNAWVEVKTSAEDDNIQQLTVHDIVEKHKNTLDSEWSPFSSREVDIGLMLLFELQAYLKKRVARNKPVIGVYKLAARYYKYSLTIVPILTATIDSLTTESGVAELGNLESSLSNVINHLRNLLKKETDNEKMARLKCLLGNVYYVKLRFEITRMRKSMENKVLANKNEEIPVLRIGDDTEDRDSSKVNPEFDFLALSKQEPIMKLMETTADYWLDSEEWMAPDVLLKSTLGYMKGMAYMYRLLCYSEREMDTWKLLFRVAVKQDCSKYQVLAVAELLLVSKDVGANFLERGKAICETQDQGVNQHNYVYQLFYINYAKNSFLNGKADDCQSLLSKIEQIKGKRILVNVQLSILNHVMNGSKVNSTIIEHFGNMLYIVKHNQWNTFNELSVIQWLLLELTHHLGSTLCDFGAVRRARTYVKSTISLAKQLVLPLRTCRLLRILGSSDNLCSDVTECEIKLSGMGTILELEALFSGADFETSCELMNKSVCKPQFIHHGEHCGCLLCANVDCQCRSLDTVCLKISCSIGKDTKIVVENLIEDGLRIIEIFEKSQSKNLFTSMEESKTRFYFAVAKHFYLNNDLKQSLTYLERTEKSIASTPVSSPLQFDVRDIKRSIECLNYNPTVHRFPMRKKNAQLSAIIITPERKPPQASINAPADPRLVLINDTKNLPPVTPKIPMFRRKILTLTNPQPGDSTGECVEVVKTPNLKAERGLIAMTPISYPGDAPLNTALKTPMAGKSTRKGRTEKMVDLFRTPVLNKFGTKPKSCIQIFCDDENGTISEPSTNNTGTHKEIQSSSTKRNMSRLKVPAVTYGGQPQRTRRLARKLSSPESDEDADSTALRPKVSQAKKNPSSIDEESVIEVTPPRRQPKALESKSTVKKASQQQSIEQQLENLSLGSSTSEPRRATRSRRKLP